MKCLYQRYKEQKLSWILSYYELGCGKKGLGISRSFGNSFSQRSNGDELTHALQGSKESMLEVARYYEKKSKKS
jgi:hypothetical protein